MTSLFSSHLLFESLHKIPRLTNKINRRMMTVTSSCFVLTNVRIRDAMAEMIPTFPVAPPSVVRKLEQQADEVICLHATEDFSGVSQFYKVFEQVEDVNVREILTRAIA